MSYQELPMACRQCAHRHSQYIYPAWSFAENERAGSGN